MKQEEEAQKSGQTPMELHHLHAKRERCLKENLNDIRGSYLVIEDRIGKDWKITFCNLYRLCNAYAISDEITCG